jgi:hypothetical protein
MRGITQHLDSCLKCNQEYVLLRGTQRLLGKVGRRKAPADLALQLRVAISQEATRTARARFEGLRVRMENALRAFMVPATVGLTGTIAIFFLIMGFLSPLQAGSPDVPLMLYTAPQLQQSAFGMSLDSVSEDSVVVEAYVDSRGRIEDYRILSHPELDKELQPQVKNMLIFTTFRPATSMGRPTSGKAILSFSKISVRG